MQEGKYIVFLKASGVVKSVQKLRKSYVQWKIDSNFERRRIPIQHWETFCFTTKNSQGNKTNSRSESLLRLLFFLSPVALVDCLLFFLVSVALS
jgi:hypothetical protein